MSIQTELTRITNAKAAIKTAIEGKGVTVPAGTLLDGMASLVDSIPAGSTPSLQSKSVTYTANGTDTITPDDGYDGLSSVDVTVDVSGGFPNGTEWTQSNITSGDFKSVYNANGIWVVASNPYGLYYSTDGKTWAQSNITSMTFNSVYNANGIWVAEASRYGLYYSTDGKVWTQSNITSGAFHSVYNANGIWVASSIAHGLYYSVTWESS